MAIDFLQDIYREADRRMRLRDVIAKGRVRNIQIMGQLWKREAQLLLESIENIDSNEREHIRFRVNEISAAISRRDVNYASDVLEYRLLPLLESCMLMQNGIDVSEGDWHIFSSDAGYLSLQFLPMNQMVHSAIDPMREAERIADYYYITSMEEMHIFGGGLGYLAYQMWVKSKETLHIYLYEPDSNIVSYGMNYGVLDRIPEKQLHIITGKPVEELLYDYVKAADIYDYHSCYIAEYVSNYYEGTSAELFRSLFSSYEATHNYGYISEINRNQNLKRATMQIDELLDGYRADEWIVVAAGPSLDERIDFLRERMGTTKIIAVAPVWKRLRKEGIIPDYIVVIDPNDVVSAMIEGLEEQTEQIVLLAAESACWRYVALFRGPKVILPDAGENAWNSCGTVTGMGITAALKLGGRKIYLVGADMGYPNNKNFASGISHEVEDVQKGELQVQGVEGGLIWTTRTLDTFRVEIEKMLREYPDVSFYNLSKGAHIEGTLEGKWWEREPLNVNEVLKYLASLREEKSLTWKQKYELVRRIVNGQSESSKDASVCELVEIIIDELFTDFWVELESLSHSYEIAPKNDDLAFIFISSCVPMSENMRMLGESIRALEDANKKILIVNTIENAGIYKVATEFCEKNGDVSLSLLEADKVSLFGKMYSYFSFIGNPLDIEVCNEFFHVAYRMSPGTMLFLDEYSMIKRFFERMSHG